MNQRVLAIDPGSRRMGYGALVAEPDGRYRVLAYGVREYPARLAFRDRLLRIHQDVIDLIEVHHPEAFAIERAFVGESPQSSMKLGEARAAAILAAARLALPVFEITPAEAKKAVTGNGRASKQQVQSMVCRMLELPSESGLDATDALSIGLAYLFRLDAVGEAVFDEAPKRRRKRGSGWTMDEILTRGLELRDG